jgi:4-hydroxy-2-oxoheptanedioate aldolase
MDLPVNRFKRALQAGRPQIGLWSILSSHVTVEVLAGAGFDWIVLDTEHAPNELPMVLSQLQATTGGTAHPIVRLPWNDTVEFKRYLDIGVQTILVPYVETAEQAAAAVAATRYPPRGVRGFSAASRAAGFGRIKDYSRLCEEELCVVVQVETRLGLQNLESIARTDGVDGVFIGPGDLSAALGHVGNLTHPDVLAVIEETIARIRACGRPAGILTGDDALIRRYLELGCGFVAIGSDVGILARGSEQLAAKYKT